MNSSREATPSKDEAQAANSSPAKVELKTETAAPAEVDAPAQVTEEPEELDQVEGEAGSQALVPQPSRGRPLELEGGDVDRHQQCVA